jgi:hypothetical protein
MRLFGRLRPLIGGAPAELPPPEVYSALIDDLHAPLFSFITGAATAVLVGAIASWRTENPWLVALTVCTAVVAAARILTIAEYRSGLCKQRRPAAQLRTALCRRRDDLCRAPWFDRLGRLCVHRRPGQLSLDNGERSGLCGRRHRAQFKPAADCHRSTRGAPRAGRRRHRAAPAAKAVPGLFESVGFPAGSE